MTTTTTTTAKEAKQQPQAHRVFISVDGQGLVLAGSLAFNDAKRAIESDATEAKVDPSHLVWDVEPDLPLMMTATAPGNGGKWSIQQIDVQAK